MAPLATRHGSIDETEGGVGKVPDLKVELGRQSDSSRSNGIAAIDGLQIWPLNDFLIIERVFDEYREFPIVEVGASVQSGDPNQHARHRLVADLRFAAVAPRSAGVSTKVPLRRCASPNPSPTVHVRRDAPSFATPQIPPPAHPTSSPRQLTPRQHSAGAPPRGRNVSNYYRYVLRLAF